MGDTNDPRDVGGSISGPGGPHDASGVVIDTTRALLLAETFVSAVDDGGDHQTFAVQLTGRVNKTTDQANLLVLVNDDGLAALVTELLGVVDRLGRYYPDAADRVYKAIEQRRREMP